MNFMVKIKIKGHSILYLTLWVLFLSLTVPVFGQEPEEIIPPCFTESELAKVKEWEKTWVGKKVNSAMVDQVKDFLPDTLVKMMKEPKKWGAKDLWFEVVPYRYSEPSKGFLEATKKYSPLSKFEPEGFKTSWGEVAPNEFLAGYLEGEIAGFPFPKPKTALEMVWNYDSLTQGDNRTLAVSGTNVNPRTGSVRNAYQPQTYMYWTGRTDVPPLLKIEPNKKRIRQTLFMVILKPADNYGNCFLDIWYCDPRKENDSYSWMAAYRRIRKLSTSQRGDSIDGNDQNFSDGWGYTDQKNRNTYKFLETRDMLACRHQDPTALVSEEKAQAFFSGQQRERCKLHIVEAVNKEKGYVYSKEIWYLDGETWQMPYKVCWDRQGRPWRFFEANVGHSKSIQGNPVIFVVGYTFVDIQRIHGCPNCFKDPQFGMELKTDMFTTQSLQRSGY